MVIEIIQREIPTRGVGYLILRDCPEDRLAEGLKKGMERLKRLGPTRFWLPPSPRGSPSTPAPWTSGASPISTTFSAWSAPFPPKNRS